LFVMILSPFLTEIDPQAEIKGSRDPLGIQPIWTRLGRRIIGNLTTVTSSVRDFTTTILGYYFAERVAHEKNADSDLAAFSELAVFLRWEQLAAYARGGINNDWQFRGTERAQKNFNEDSKLRLGTDSAALILSDQKTYGLWGLYSVASRSSGLLVGNPARVAPPVRKFIEDEYLPTLSGKGRGDASEIVGLLARKSPELRPLDRDRPLLQAVGRALQTKLSGHERTFYQEYLVEGGPKDSTQGAQRVLVNALKTTFEVEEWSLKPAAIRHLAKHCRAQDGRGEDVADCLQRICVAEQLLAPAASLFMLLLACDDQLPDDVSATIRKRWGPKVASINPDEVDGIRGEFADSQDEQASSDRWVRLAQALASGDYDVALSLLIEQNRAVMQSRGGAAPWVEIRNGKLHVRFLEESGSQLPPRSELASLWINSYFIDSLRTVAMQVEGRHG
jgi:hypothetical protein